MAIASVRLTYRLTPLAVFLLMSLTVIGADKRLRAPLAKILAVVVVRAEVT